MSRHRPLCEDALTMQQRSATELGWPRHWLFSASLAHIKGDYESARTLYERSLSNSP